MYVWKRGSPHPGPVPNGYLMGCLPHAFWQVWDEIEGMNMREIKKRRVIFIFTVVEREGERCGMDCFRFLWRVRERDVVILSFGE